MSSIELLDKTRTINALLHRNLEEKVAFSDICSCLKRLMSADALVISKKGKILGRSTEKKGRKNWILEGEEGAFLDEALNRRLLSILSTKENVNLETLGLSESNALKSHVLIAPIIIGGKRFGTLFVSRDEESYSIEDIILCEYATTVVGLEILRSVSEEDAEEIRKEQVLNAAINSLTVTEFRALKGVLESLKEGENLVVTSKLADKMGITRSIVVNALRKMGGAGVFRVNSAGSKGTFIEVLNEDVLQFCEKVSH